MNAIVEHEIKFIHPVNWLFSIYSFFRNIHFYYYFFISQISHKKARTHTHIHIIFLFIGIFASFVQNFIRFPAFHVPLKYHYSSSLYCIKINLLQLHSFISVLRIMRIGSFTIRFRVCHNEQNQTLN